MELLDEGLHTSNSSATTPFTVSCCWVENYWLCVQHEIRWRLELLLTGLLY